MMNLLELSMDDLNLYFAGTCVKMFMSDADKERLKTKDGWISVRKFECQMNEENAVPKWNIFVFPQMDFYSGNIRPILLEKPDQFVTKLPYTGHYNFKSSSVLISRTICRQNKKGIYDGTYNATPFVSMFNKIINFPLSFKLQHNFSLRPTDIEQITRTKFQDLQKTFVDIKASRVFSRAVSPDILLSVGLKTRNPSLWIGKSYVGSMVSPKELVVEVPVLFEEAREKLRGYNLNFVKHK